MLHKFWCQHPHEASQQHVIGFKLVNFSGKRRIKCLARGKIGVRHDPRCDTLTLYPGQSCCVGTTGNDCQNISGTRILLAGTHNRLHV